MSDDPFKLDYVPSKEESQKISMFYKALLDQATYFEAQQKLIPTSVVTEYLSSTGSKIRTALSQLPDRMAPRLSHESDESTIFNLLMREVEGICRDIERMWDEEEVQRQVPREKPVLRAGKISSKHRGDLED